jgi:hypothetical protein
MDTGCFHDYLRQPSACIDAPSTHQYDSPDDEKNCQENISRNTVDALQHSFFLQCGCRQAAANPDLETASVSILTHRMVIL